jgi:hypothetical protein
VSPGCPHFVFTKNTKPIKAQKRGLTPLLKNYSQKVSIRKITQKFYDLSSKYFDISLSAVVKSIKEKA